MRTSMIGLIGVSWPLVMACSGGDPGPSEGETGTLRAALELSALEHDVTAVRLDLVAPDQGCDGPVLFSQTVGLEAEALPSSVAGSGAHAFADALFVLAPGSYRVCATPLAGEGASSECSPTDALAEVAAGATTETFLVSQCQSTPNGGVDVVVALNDQPEITEVMLDPSGFISVCETLSLTATATDPNDDDLSYAWSVLAGPDGSSLRATGASATFSGAAGDYTLELSVDDGHGGTSSLSFPVHVSDAVCAVPAEVQAIFSARCTPCHTTGSSGGLHLDPATASYANLVGVGSSSASCAGRTRVIPGDAASSYLIAKLRGTSGICGLRMPRNLPPLPEEEIATIEAWIDGLPH